MSDVQGVKLVEVIELYVPRGLGIKSNPMRMVRQFFSKDGELLAEADPVTDKRLHSREEAK